MLTTTARRARAVALLGPSLLAAGACVGRATDAVSVASDDIEWTAFGNEPALDGLECATVAVPLDHAEPGGDTIDLALARRPADRPDARIGTLFLNPGGPGASGVELVNQLATVAGDALLDRFDLVGFDPRGVGRSTAVRCIADPDALIALDGDPDTPEEVSVLLETNADIAADCSAAYTDLLPHLTTAATARDLDLLRAAVGDEKLSYLGFSYGTQLGAVYAQLFPDRVRALVLDGAVAVDLSEEELARTQARGFERAFDAFVEACRTDTACAAHPDVAAVYERVRTAVEAAPIPVSTKGDTRAVTAGTLAYGVLGALYEQALRGLLAEGLVAADGGDGAGLLALSDLYHQRRPDGTFPNLNDAFRAISCADSTLRPDLAAAQAQAAEIAQVAPRFGDGFGWSMLSCTGWPEGAEPMGEVSAPTAPPTLVIGTTGDPATPYAWAKRLVATLAPNARLLSYEGEGHTAYPSSECVRALVDRYLLEGTVPEEGMTCSDTAEVTGSAFEGLAAELRGALDGVGLPEPVVDCIADKVAGQLSAADLVASNAGELPPDLQTGLTEAAEECAGGG